MAAAARGEPVDPGESDATRVWLEAWPSPKVAGLEHSLELPADAKEWQLLDEWVAAKVAGVFDKADALREVLRSSGCNPRHARGACAGRRAVTPKEDGDSDAAWAENLRYDPGWHSRCKVLGLVSQQTYLAGTPGWSHTPRVRGVHSPPCVHMAR
jgi:hypothetical protein